MKQTNTKSQLNGILVGYFVFIILSVTTLLVLIEKPLGKIMENLAMVISLSTVFLITTSIILYVVYTGYKKQGDN